MRKIEYVVTKVIKVDGKVIWDDEDNYDYSESVQDAQEMDDIEMDDADIKDWILSDINWDDADTKDWILSDIN